MIGWSAERKQREAAYLRDRRRREAARRAAERRRERREQKQLELHQQRAEQGDERSKEWLEKHKQSRLLLGFYQSGYGRPGPKPDTDDGWSYSEGKYLPTTRRS